ncbi:MAG: hypothetical protein AB7Q42_12075 [Acidimicrobiia bacterium]
MTGPTVVIGNDDDRLDPGEQWSYRVGGEYVMGYTVVYVTATTLTGAEIWSSAEVWTKPADPIKASVSTTTSVVTAGDTVVWTMDVSNVADFALVINPITDGPHPYGAFLFQPDSFSGESLQLVGPDGDGQTGNGLLDPGETWRWSCSSAVRIDGSYLEVQFGYGRVGGVVHFQRERSAPVRVNQAPVISDSTIVDAIAPTTAPSATASTARMISARLAETGPSDVHARRIALGLVAAGAALLVFSRHRVRSTR